MSTTHLANGDLVMYARYMSNATSHSSPPEQSKDDAHIPDPARDAKLAAYRHIAEEEARDGYIERSVRRAVELGLL